MFKPLPSVPDHPALERELLERWEAEGTFHRLREQNADGPRFRFMDGPITANAPAGVHHGIGRTLKDVFHRYKAMRGHRLRYQNGFDSQGLHVEVQVEKALGLNSKREIEEFGVAEFARRCREFVAEYAGVQTAQFKRLGQWMDWGNDYFTFSDTNIAYIWRFLRSATAAAGCTRATARPSGVPAAARRSRSTSRQATRTTPSSSTHRSSSASR